MDLRAHNGRAEDRLATAVCLAALLHGLVILGIRFTSPPSDEQPLPTLEVLLVPEGPVEPANQSFFIPAVEKICLCPNKCDEYIAFRNVGNLPPVSRYVNAPN